MTPRPRRNRSRRLLGLLAAPILIGSCAPQCSPVPPAPPASDPPVATEPAPTTTAPAPTTTAPPPPTPVWAYLARSSDGGYTRWDPCGDPITYRIDRTVAPTATEVAAIRDALVTASAATGFAFQEITDGTSGAEAVIGVKDFTSPPYPSGTLGEGGGNFDRVTGEMTSGLAYVQRGLDAARLRYVLLHELGHMLGLGHVPSSAEVMYTWAIPPWKQQYAAGDREGLRTVGTAMTCFPTEMLRTQADEETIILN